jgi:hypothetical protein
VDEILPEIFNVHRVSDVRKMEIHTTEPLVLKPNLFEVEIAIEKVKTHKSPYIDKILLGLIQAGDENYVLRSINSLIYLE